MFKIPKYSSTTAVIISKEIFDLWLDQFLYNIYCHEIVGAILQCSIYLRAFRYSWIFPTVFTRVWPQITQHKSRPKLRSGEIVGEFESLVFSTHLKNMLIGSFS